VANAASDGIPCLVPVELELADGASARGFITRLSPLMATVSTDPSLDVGQALRLRFHRPTDGQPVDVEGKVSALVSEGGLWRGRPAAVVELSQAVQDDFASDSSDLRVRVPSRERRGAEPARRASDVQGVSMGKTFKASGLGRRRRAGPATSSSTQIPPVTEAPTDPGTPPRDGQAAKAPPSTPAPRPSAADAELRELASIDVSHDVPQLQPSASDEASPDAEDDFFGIFDAEDESESAPGVGPSETAAAAEEDCAESVLATTSYPEGIGGISTSPPSVVLGPGQVAADAKPPIREDEDTLRSGTTTGNRRPPWESGPAEQQDPSIPRHVRISSRIEVTFWARGRSNSAIAQNFSKEGLFLSFAGDPPIRGAIVRVEFPVAWASEKLPVRFNAEVRWHRSDQPNLATPEGFGVQILTFESPKDQARYEQLLALLLQVTPNETEPPPVRFYNPKTRN